MFRKHFELFRNFSDENNELTSKIFRWKNLYHRKLCHLNNHLAFTNQTNNKTNNKTLIFEELLRELNL